jgi:hypothetical protein
MQTHGTDPWTKLSSDGTNPRLLRLLGYFDHHSFGLLQACIPLSFDILTDGDWFNETKGKELYAKHYEHVRKLVPKERLLEFDMPFRWGPPLCEFLGVKDVPEEEYSRTNTATNVEVLYTMVTKQAACNLMKRGAWPAVSAVVLGVAGYLKLSGKV